MTTNFYSIRRFLIALGATLLAGACIDSEALRGRIIVTLTDSPIDASNISKVNIAIRSIEVLPLGGDTWQVLKSFEDPRTVDLLEYTQGKSYNLTEQFSDPGDYEAIRLELNLANVSSGLIVFPQSTIIFSDGTQQSLFVDGNSNYVEARGDFGITTNITTFLTLDFDLRKSVVLTGDGYKLKPSMRVIETPSSGGIDGQFRDFSTYSRVVVFAYRSGTFNESETTGDQPFVNAVSSALVKNSVGGRFYLTFLPEATYDLLFVQHDETGAILEVLGKQSNVSVVPKEDTFLSVFKADLQ